MQIYFSTRELATENPDAFDALPEAYQADDCLKFWYAPSPFGKIVVAYSARGFLHTAAKNNAEAKILGRWTMFFNGENWVGV